MAAQRQRESVCGSIGTRETHHQKNKQEATPIRDTAPTHWQQPRDAARDRAFIPVGHVALDLRPAENRHLGLADGDGIVWVAGLYVSYALQGRGLGREAMGLAEHAAASPPLGARWAALDTMPRAQQLDPAFVEKVYLAQGRPAPARAVQDWYEGQGYEVFAGEKGGYRWANPETGEREDIDYVFLRKRLG